MCPRNPHLAIPPQYRRSLLPLTTTVAARVESIKIPSGVIVVFRPTLNKTGTTCYLPQTSYFHLCLQAPLTNVLVTKKLSTSAQACIVVPWYIFHATQRENYCARNRNTPGRIKTGFQLKHATPEKQYFFFFFFQYRAQMCCAPKSQRAKKKRLYRAVVARGALLTYLFLLMLSDEKTIRVNHREYRRKNSDKNARDRDQDAVYFPRCCAKSAGCPSSSICENVRNGRTIPTRNRENTYLLFERDTTFA